MDPIALSTAIAAFLAPLLTKFGEQAAESLGEKMPEAVGKLWDAIESKFRGKPTAEGAAKELAAKPADEDNQETFAIQLRKALKEDPAFAAELEHLLAAAQASAGATASGEGVAASDGGVAVRGDVKGGVRVQPGDATQGGASATDKGVAASSGGVAIGGSVEGGITIGGKRKDK